MPANALNNGSWTYMVPIAIEPGRYSFSIGINPFLLSDTSAIFVFEPSQVSSVSPASVPIGTPSYNGCGLPPVPGYTYTGYQPPCTVTTNDQVKTLYPVVPASDSSSFFGSMAPETTTPTSIASPASIATDIYAQALQCPTPITPSPTTITASGATTIFSLVGCATALAASPSISNSSNVGVCHTSGYTTFSVSGASSVCCPDGWATTPLTADLFCFMTIRGTRAELFGQVSTETVETSPNTVVEISGLAFTRAGVVVNEVAAGSTSTSVVDSSTAITTTTTGAGASTTKKSGGGKLRLRVWETLTTVGMLSYLVL